MNTPKYPYRTGWMRFEFGHKPVLVKQGAKFYIMLGIEADRVSTFRVTYPDFEEYFGEMHNSEDDLREVKKVARYLLSKSKMSGLKREMSKPSRIVIREILDL